METRQIHRNGRRRRTKPEIIRRFKFEPRRVVFRQMYFFQSFFVLEGATETAPEKFGEMPLLFKHELCCF